MDETLNQINAYYNERMALYRKSSAGTLTPAGRARMIELNDILYNTWDRYRSERAAVVNATAKEDTRRQRIARIAA